MKIGLFFLVLLGLLPGLFLAFCSAVSTPPTDAIAQRVFGSQALGSGNTMGADFEIFGRKFEVPWGLKSLRPAVILLAAIILYLIGIVMCWKTLSGR